MVLASTGRGLILWLRAPANMDLRMQSPFCARCIEEGVLYVPGDLCFAHSTPLNCARLAFGALSIEALGEAAERFCRVAHTFAPSSCLKGTSGNLPCAEIADLL